MRSDATGMTGTVVAIPNSLWEKRPDDNWEVDATSDCQVVGRCASNYAYTGAKPAPSHYDGEYFPVKTSALKGFKQSEDRRKRKQAAR